MTVSKKKYSRKWPLFTLSLMAILLGFANLAGRRIQQPKVLAANDPGQEEILFWEKLVLTNPTYIDALIRLSFFEFQRGNLERAKYYFFTAYKLSPNTRSVLEVKKLLGL